MLYAVDDIVSLSAARGSWEGVIAETHMIGASPAYLVYRVPWTHRKASQAIVHEADIDSSHTTYPTWQVNDAVTLYGEAGTITAITGTVYTVTVTDERTYYTLTRTHQVPRWRLYLENQ